MIIVHLACSSLVYLFVFLIAFLFSVYFRIEIVDTRSKSYPSIIEKVENSKKCALKGKKVSFLKIVKSSVSKKERKVDKKKDGGSDTERNKDSSTSGKKRASEVHDLGEEKVKKRLKVKVDAGACKIILIFLLFFI